MIEALAATAAQHTTADAAAWLRAQLAAGLAGFPPAFAAAGRRIGTAAIGADGAARIAERGLRVPPELGADECARGALVLAAVAATPAGEQVALVRDLIRRGEVRERQAVLRVLAALPEPARLVELAIDACRSNVQTVFEAVACDNAFAARHFPAEAFDQLVLKALFVGAPLGRIDGLAGRITPELVRKVEAFASERRAAGRPVPDDARLVR
ncbi:MAG TPA: EboA domain-containing protein [Kofleriaceae bacterium]|nr:EboA domain-containing protein [Kofleriaceae bacterium]